MAKKYSFADHPEHRDALAAHHERWLRVPLDCTPMTDDDRAACAAAVREMYRMANISGEPRIVFVPSPFVAQIAAGFAAAIWHLRTATMSATDDATESATRDATGDATFAATISATDDATYAATYAATMSATEAATYAATRAATYAATYAATDNATISATEAATISATDDATRAATISATRAATDAATYAATYAATMSATDDATESATYAATISATFLLTCAARAWRMRNSGNQWSGWVEMLAFFRDVAALNIDFAPLAPYESLAKLSGPRYAHEKFCIVSDKPEYIKGYWRDGRFIAHCEDGPSHRWRDGSCIYTWHGRQIGWRFGARSGGNPDIIDHPETITVAAIQSEPNAEIRRAAIAKFGAVRYLREANATLVHEDEFGKLWRCARPGDTPIVMLECRNGSPEPIGYAPTDGESGEWVGKRWVKHYWLRVPPTIQTARAAEAWIHGLDHAEQYAPQVRT